MELFRNIKIWAIFKDYVESRYEAKCTGAVRQAELIFVFSKNKKRSKCEEKHSQMNLLIVTVLYVIVLFVGMVGGGIFGKTKFSFSCEVSHRQIDGLVI